MQTRWGTSADSGWRNDADLKSPVPDHDGQICRAECKRARPEFSDRDIHPPKDIKTVHQTYNPALRAPDPKMRTSDNPGPGVGLLTQVFPPDVDD